jgi:hypothetical protein
VFVVSMCGEPLNRCVTASPVNAAANSGSTVAIAVAASRHSLAFCSYFLFAPNARRLQPAW